MATRMLVDASHDEETRVVIVKGTRLEEFDYETASKKQLKGNIYLAKVTRVEPSLQAAFVEYGGNRHGFLPFSEIHPDYYQIPVSDREELLAEENLAEKQAEDEVDEELEAPTSSEGETAESSETEKTDVSEPEEGSDAASQASPDEDEEGVVDDEGDTLGGLETVDDDAEDVVENLGGDDEPEITRKALNKRNYKIQEVIKRRQILLVQVVKEERGNKGAALTTYISLPGRYSVLMPNTGRGGGISRKISNPADRKRLKKIASELEVPEGIGVIIRTAGLNRTKVEIKRDYEFLLRLWDDIRELTLKSIAPVCVYEEANLIKRSIRDLYNKDINEILVEGDEGYRTAKDFMRKLMPSHAKKVQPYRDRIPLFHRFQVEQQFASMYNPEVQLKSGGYIVINPTEALVSIDVNSGKATKERSIEETALKTNMEAAEEIARQLRLRDLAGLIVIDFIDMDDNRNNKAVERKLKECLKSDRARIQVGRISAFGLLEMSRQRLRPSFLETSTNTCHTCGGSGFVRSTESTALLIIRALEEEGVRERSSRLTVTVNTEVAIYLLNQKRSVIQELETLYGLTIMIMADPTMNLNDHRIDREKGEPNPQRQQQVQESPVEPIEDRSGEDEDKPEGESNSAKRRRRRRRRKNNRDNRQDQQEGVEATQENETEETSENAEDDEPRKRRRGKRGGRRRSRTATSDETDQNDVTSEDGSEPEVIVIPIAASDDSAQTATTSEEPASEEKKSKPRRGRRKKSEDETSDAKQSDEENQSSEEGETPEKVRPRRGRGRRKSEKTSEKAAEMAVAEANSEIEPEMVPLTEVIEEKPKRASRRKPKAKEETEQTPSDAPSTAPSEAQVTETQSSNEASTEAPAPSETETVTTEEPKTERKPRRRGWWNRRRS
ncbi:ribonuclease E/G [Sneathiella limimaris]|uniref:ribonuclease E/G n=1 Tax=Sneathiella limimaris TaxID=1964213 RepID=UPI00146B2EF9|nr:ribonuclease E/G [Sneathiella limimaris]